MNQRWRLTQGVVLAGGIAVLAARRASLSHSGAIAATFIGALAYATGWHGTRALLAFFGTSTALSHLSRNGHREPPRRTASQVLANGGVAGVAWALDLLGTTGPWRQLAVGSLAAAAADTWATEIGQRYGGAPRSITSGRPVRPGESGGVTTLGTAAAIAGAMVVAMSDWCSEGAVAVIAAGVSGSIADSLLGASLQARFRCGACGLQTEQPTHCGQPAALAGGSAWITNDAVNALATLIGGAVAIGGGGFIKAPTTSGPTAPS